jgi:hypothetical protein
VEGYTLFRLQENIHANGVFEDILFKHLLVACASIFKPLSVTSIGGSVIEQIASFPASKASVGKLPSIKRYQGTFSPFPEPDFPQGSMTPDHHLIGITYATRGGGELSFTTTSMTPWVTHEINRTVAALAAETRSSPTVADKSCVTRKAQPALRPRLPYARPACFKGIK